MRCDCQISNKLGMMQMLTPIAFYSLGKYCMHRINIPWNQLTINSTATARNLNRLRTATCCIGISGALQTISGSSRLSTGDREVKVRALDAGSVALFSYLLLTAKIHSLFIFAIFGMQRGISNVYIRSKTYQPTPEEQVPQRLDRLMQMKRQLTDQEAKDLIDNIIKIKIKTILSLNQTSIEVINNSIELIVYFRKILIKLYELDQSNYQGFNPENELVEKLGMNWGILIQLLPAGIKSKFLIEFIEIFSTYNYSLDEQLSHYPDDTELKNWKNENYRYFEHKWRILNMGSPEMRLKELKVIQKDLNPYTDSQKLDLLNIYLLRIRQLKAYEINDIFEYHKIRYESLVDKIANGVPYHQFLTMYRF